MTFFDPNNKPITMKQWRTTYQPYYFLGGPTYRQTLNSKNQSSRYVEAEVEKLLKRPQGQLLTADDLKLIMAWKLGAVNHKRSEGKIVFDGRWQDHLISQGQWGARDFSKGIQFLSQKMKTLERRDAKAIWDFLAQSKSELPNFGPVYWLTVLYFIKRGESPIFDKFASIAVNAILADAKVGTAVYYNPSPGWVDYLDYVAKLKTIFGSQNIPRQDDQCLWVYGHFFGAPQSEKDKTKEHGGSSRSESRTSAVGILEGKVTEPHKDYYEINIPTNWHMLPSVPLGPGLAIQLRYHGRACECVLHVKPTLVWISTNGRSPFYNPIKLYDFLRSIGKERGNLLYLQVNGTNLVVQ
jgi:hypothetical protein